MQIPAFYGCRSQYGLKCFRSHHRHKCPVMVKVCPRFPCAASQALYLTMFPCSSHFLLKSQQQPIASLPSGKSSIFQVSIFFSIFISAAIAAFHSSFSSLCIASSKLFRSRSSFSRFASASMIFQIFH
jgi:hypothetical protein